MSKSAGVEVARARQRYKGRGGIYGETLAAALGTYDGHNHACWHDAAMHILSPPLRPDPTTPEGIMRLLAK